MLPTPLSSLRVDVGMRPLEDDRRTPLVLAASFILFATVMLAGCGAPASSSMAEPGTRPGSTETVAADGIETAAEDGIRLVALVTVDQLRPDHLTRYADLWSGGLQRLLQEGHGFTAASHAHAFTETAAGHATISTGTVPARHGIVANDWSSPDGRGGWTGIYAVEDLDAPILAGPGSPSPHIDRLPGRSPKNLRRDGLGDWIKASHPDAEIVGISRKDRAAITLAGRSPDAHVYWIDAPSGRFVTSDWYRDPYPQWLNRFNRDVMPSIFADTVWTSIVPAAAAHRSRPDTATGEGDGVHTAFPHRAWQEAVDPEARQRLQDSAGAGESDVPTEIVTELNEWVYDTPAMDRAVVELALEAIDALRLGQDDVPDLLALSPSQTDAVGHDYGPLSREQLDNLLRLDRELGRLFDALDRRVGADRWILAFSSDHGVLDLPGDEDPPAPSAAEETESQNPDPRPELRRLGRAELQQMRDILGMHGSAEPTGDETGPASDELVRALEALPYVAAVYPHPIDGRATVDMPADTFLPLYRNSWFEGRYPGEFSRYGAEVRFEEGVLLGYPRRGTGHGTPYWYDRHVPIIFLGGPVAPGSSDDPAYTYDVAPTLADLARIPVPDDLDGRVLSVRTRADDQGG